MSLQFQSLLEKEPYNRTIEGLGNLAIGVAGDIDRLRPELLIVPLTGGFPVYKLSFEALRTYLRVKTEDYDPLVVYTSMSGYSDYNSDSKTYLKKILEKYRKFGRIMILDEVRSGHGLVNIINNHRKELLNLGKEIYVSCFADNSPDYVEAQNRIESQTKEFQILLHRDERILSYPLRDSENQTGLVANVITIKKGRGSSFRVNYSPTHHSDGRTGELVYQFHWREIYKDVVEFLKRVSEFNFNTE